MAPKPKTALAVFVGAPLVNDLYATVMQAFLPALADEFGLDYRQLGLLSAAVIVFSGVLQPVIGSAADRHGRRRFFLIAGFVIAAVGLLAMSVAPNYAVAVAFGAVYLVGRSVMNFFVEMLVDDGWSNTSAGMMLTAILMVGAVAQPIGGVMFGRLGGRRVFELSASGTVVLVGFFAVASDAVSLLAVVGIAFFMFSLFPVSLAYASRLVPTSQTGAATGAVFGVSGLMTAAAQPIVGAIAGTTGDLRSALAWLPPVATVGLAMSVGLPDERVDPISPP